jgi:FAD/FMN-containing dehydrogenase
MDGVSRRQLLELGALVSAGAVVTACGGSSGKSSTTAAPTTTAAPPPATLTGRVVRPDASGYTAARTDWDRLFASYPLVVVFAQSTQDVVNAVSWARQNDVAIRVRSGRHNLQGWSNLDGGIVIDVSQMKGVQVDASAGTAKVGAGLTQQEVVDELAGSGRTVPTGTEGGVGLSGATLGGGFGLITRNFGMACDNLVAAEIVVPSGGDSARAITVNDKTNSDLLWALRGAGNGNFGVVTSMTFTTHPLTDAVFVLGQWDGLNDIQAVFDAWQKSMPTADKRLTTVLEIDQSAMKLYAVLAGGTAAQAKDLVSPVLSAGSPSVTVNASSYRKIYDGFQSPRMTANWVFWSQFVSKPYPAAAIDLVAKYMRDAPAPPSNFFCQSWGGAVKSAPVGGSAFVHREPLFYAEPGAGWNGSSITERAQTWLAEFARALEPYADGAYVNVPNAAMANWEQAYWGSNYARLRDIKRKYDPENVFRYEQSVAPAR